ncbi:hypothetical protein FDG2_1994 [Candidatus Protofrankia californiensis]|uniref:Uncharacterized protein n=1 Tax=Candidatus Protofrankia californiensis TaxID=1839754 RepID=A0A1C3NWQ3_9ACTN|nr:hypothetical protein FDG2_1994 [Candidatus Protofrankia californiensis]
MDRWHQVRRYISLREGSMIALLLALQRPSDLGLRLREKIMIAQPLALQRGERSGL